MRVGSVKPPSWNEIRANARAFVPRWEGTTSEQGEAQTFWNEFLAIFGVDRRRVALFEKHVKRTSSGKDGRIDLYWPGTLVAEHKSAGRSLDDAEAQALDYLDDLDPGSLPQIVVTSDFAHIRILDLSTPGASAFTFALADLPQEIDRLGFLAGYAKRVFTAEQESQANINAARLMGLLYEELADDGHSDHETSVLLARLLFLMFGDDTGMWQKGLLTELLLTRTSADGSDVGGQLAALFQVLDTPQDKRPGHIDELMARFPYVNGGLFAEAIRIPFFNRAMRSQLLAAADFDWSQISPAIFGSMFQAVKDKEARRQLGEHYTTEANIQKVIGPLLTDGLRERFEAARTSAPRLQALRADLGRYTLFDPACGCGNFLVIAYRELRRLELDILKALRDLDGDHQLALDVTLDLAVGLGQFHGIEIEEWPAQIAETAMFLVDHQENIALAREFGDAPDRLPITTAATITRGNALRIDWLQSLGMRPDPADTPDVARVKRERLDRLVVLGNPPFVGMAWMDAEQQADNREAFAPLETAGLRTGRMDYVACWYAKAIAALEGSKARAAFVSTNSLTQGEQARTMVPLIQRHGFKVDFAHRTFRWTSEAPSAAAVHVVVVGFSHGGQARRKRLFDYPDIKGQPVETEPGRINFYLIDADDVAPVKVHAPLVPGMPNATQGNKPWDGGHLLVTPAQYPTVAADPIAAKYLRRFMQSTEMLYGKDRWCLWLPDAPPADLRTSPVLRERLAAVAAARRESPTLSVQAQAATPSLFTQIRQPHRRYLALPEVSSENREWIPGAFYEPDVIAGNKLIAWEGADLWHFAYLQSSAFMAWVRTYCGRLKSDFSLSPGLVYFTFPFVPPSGAKRDGMRQAAQALLDARAAHPGASLADLYDPLGMPKNVQDAHRAIDVLVDGLHGLRRPTESQRMKALVRDYEQIAAPTLAATRTRRAPRARRPGLIEH